MFYREAGDFKTSYDADNQTFPIAFDRYRYWVVLAIAFLVVPFIISDYWANALLIPFLIYAIAAIGLNILVGYCGQVSLGTGAFMAVGAYACYKLMTAFPDINILDPCAAGGWDYRTGRCGLWTAIIAHQRLLSGSSHTGCTVLPGLVVQ